MAQSSGWLTLAARRFHVELLRELESHGRYHDDRWVVIVSAEITAARWVSTQLDDLA